MSSLSFGGLAGHRLVLRVGAKICALPLAEVAEVSRALPVEGVPEAPAMIEGLAVLRGRPCPVVDLARLLGSDGGEGRYFVRLAVDDRHLALRVDSMIGVRAISDGVLEDIPPLLDSSLGEVVAQLETVHSELIYILSVARIVPEELWEEVQG